ncbi:MAG: AMP-binding protein [Dermatophilaceae bacterium]
MARNPDPAGQDRPWSRWYAERRLGPLAAHPDLVTMAAAAARSAPDRLALTYHGWTATHAELARLSDGFAAYLASRGVRRGDRVAVCLQTSPHFVVAALGAWKVGAILVTMNPMYREGEVAHLLGDSGAVAVVSSQQGYRTVVAPVLAGTVVRVSVTTSEVDVIDDPDPRVFAGLTDEAVEGTDDLMTVARGHADDGFPAYQPAPGDVAVLCYTSGTTGPAKGAMLTHANIATTIALNSQWLGTQPGWVIYGTAPLFHVVGLVLQVAHALHLAGTLVLPYRTIPEVMLEHLVEYRPRFVVCPPTVYTALMAVPSATPEAFASLDLLYAGGAVLPPAVVERFLERFGKYVNNGYGLTETAGACVFAVPGRRARMDEASQALSNGVPLPGMDVRIVGDDGQDLPIGERGEIVVKGPCVTPGYWQNPNETANAIHDGWFATGDIGFIDDEGMLYCVDRKKDMIVASGFKVWPGEVEQVLLTHPAVMEAAVVGMPDAYRGESVKAFVIPRPGSQVSPEELAAWCKARLATFKAPREVQVVADLPRTASGKVLKRELR